MHNIPNAPELLAACKAVLNEFPAMDGRRIESVKAICRLAIANAERDGMTAEEHILRWIENSAPHFKRLQRLSVPGNFIGNRDRAGFAFSLAADAQREMIKRRDAYSHEQSESDLLRAAAALCDWRAPE